VSDTVGSYLFGTLRPCQVFLPFRKNRQIRHRERKLRGGFDVFDEFSSREVNPRPAFARTLRVAVGAVATGRMLRKIERVRTMHVAHVSSTFYRSGDWHLVQGTPGETVWKGAAVGCANGSVHVPRESVRKGF